MTELVARTRLTAPPTRPLSGGLLLIERNVMVYRRTWMILFSGFFEPLFYLFFFVYPLQSFIGDVSFDGDTHGVHVRKEFDRYVMDGARPRTVAAVGTGCWTVAALAAGIRAARPDVIPASRNIRLLSIVV